MTALKPRLVRAKTVPNEGILRTLKTSLRAGTGAAALLAAVMPPTAYLVHGGGSFTFEELHGDGTELKLVFVWTMTVFFFWLVNLIVWFGGLDVGKHYLVRAVIGFTRQGPWNFRRLLEEANQRDLVQRVGGGYMFVNRPVMGYFATLNLPPPQADSIRDPEWHAAESSEPLMTAMAAIWLIGAVMLFAGVASSTTWAIVTGAALLGLGAQWLVLRTAITSALRASRREGEDD